jgi:hypothetical protein
MSPTRLLCVFLCVLHSSVAYVRSINEDRFPYMIDTESQKPLDWGSGSLLHHTLASSAIRVSDNRIRFIPAGWTVIQSQGSSAACLPHSEALCIVNGNDIYEATGVGHKSKIFPAYDTGVTIHGNISHSCIHGSGRVCLASPSTVYDVSVCDTVDGSLDVLFVNDRVHLVQIKLNNVLYVTSGIFVVLLIVFVTQNLAIDIMSDRQSQAAVSMNMSMMLSMILTVCSCVLPGMVNEGSPGLFVPLSTETDLYSFCLIIAYMILHAAIWLVKSLWRHFCHNETEKSVSHRMGHLHNVNFMVCAIILSIFSTHGCLETVLTTPLLFVLLFRTIFKMYMIEHCSVSVSPYQEDKVAEWKRQCVQTMEAFLIAIDCIVIILTYTVGTGPQADTYLHGISSFCMIFFIAHALAYEATNSIAPQ